MKVFPLKLQNKFEGLEIDDSDTDIVDTGCTTPMNGASPTEHGAAKAWLIPHQKKLYCHNLLCQEIYLQTEGTHQLAENKTLFCSNGSTPIRIDDQCWIMHHGYPSHG